MKQLFSNNNLNTKIKLQYSKTELISNFVKCDDFDPFFMFEVDIADCLWELIIEDPNLCEADIMLFSIDDDAYINYIANNFNQIVENNIDTLKFMYREEALQQLYKQISN